MGKSQKSAKRAKAAKAASQATAKAAAKAKSFRTKLEARFEKTLENAIEKTMAVPKIAQARDSALAAKKTIDETLLDLQHRALELRKDPQDLIQKVGHKVLERAEAVRAQLAEQPYSPAWLKDLSLTPKMDVTPSAAAKASTEAGEMEESKEDTAEDTAAGAIVDTENATVTLAGAAKRKSRAKKSAGVSAKPVH